MRDGNLMVIVKCSGTPKKNLLSFSCSQHKLLLQAITGGLLSSLDSPELVNNLYSDLLSLVEFLLDSSLAYVNSLGSAPSPKTDKARARFERDRFALIEPFLTSGQDESASYLAEKYRDFEILLRLCDASGNTPKLGSLMEKFANEGFAR